MNAEKGLGGIDLTDTVTTTVEVASPAGHETFQLTQDQTSGQLVQPAQLADADWETIGTVRITPGLVGGSC